MEESFGGEDFEMKILVVDERNGQGEFTAEGMAELAGVKLAASDRVPGVEGNAFDLKNWYAVWKQNAGKTDGEEPTHVRVEAADEFQATIPWRELHQAFFLYEQNNQPLKKGYPIRLYVPDGSSSCLNVKSVVKVYFLYDAALGDAAEFGFKNRITPEDLRIKKD
jgi:hypothetical protein